MNKGLFSSATDEWATPQALFDELDAEFHFNLDPASTDLNHKCQRYFTKAEDGLLQSWGGVSSVLQSTIRQADRTLGREGRGRSGKAIYNGCYAFASPNRYEMVPRIYLRSGRGSVY